MWELIFSQLTPEASVAIRKGNYERLFDAARARVRAWEQEHVKQFWGRRTDNDGRSADDARIQFSVKYSFSRQFDL